MCQFFVNLEETFRLELEWLRIELFVVLEHGCRAGLSIARFVQVKGAVSGFRKVIEVVDGVMRSQGKLVEDEDKWRALCEVVDG